MMTMMKMKKIIDDKGEHEDAKDEVVAETVENECSKLLRYVTVSYCNITKV